MVSSKAAAAAPGEAKPYPTHPDAQTPAARGDTISGDRYWSREFAEREWEHMWKRVWHVGGRTAQLQEPGDFIVHDLRHESVLMVKQRDGDALRHAPIGRGGAGGR